MIPLRGELLSRFDAEPTVRVLCDETTVALFPPERVARLSRSPSGALALRGVARTPLELPTPLSYLAAGDVVRVSPRSGEVRVLYRKSSPHNTIFTTDRCNSNCLMCSQPPRDVDDSFLIDVWRAAIPLMDKSTVEIGFTGGEPTLLGDRFIELLQLCKQHLPSTSIHVLSNGRLFNYLRFARALADVEHPDLMVGIPLYSDLADVHNFVVQADGAFDQTLRGIMNLKRCGVPVELRVVLHQATLPRLVSLAQFITRNLPNADHVALMGLEITGHTRMHLDAMWADPVDYAAELAAAVELLAAARLRVSIYNHQLCLLPQALWAYARRSISDWKNEYVDACTDCGARAHCGGFFMSSSHRRSRGIHAIPVLL